MSHYEKGCVAKLSSDFLPDAVKVAGLQLEMAMAAGAERIKP
jgi:hypothetical protein